MINSGIALFGVNSGVPVKQKLQNYVTKPCALSKCNIMQDSSTHRMNPLKINSLLTSEVMYTDCECLCWWVLTHLRHLQAISFAGFGSHWGMLAILDFTDRLVLFLKFAHTFWGPKT